MFRFPYLWPPLSEALARLLITAVATTDLNRLIMVSVVEQGKTTVSALKASGMLG